MAFFFFVARFALLIVKPQQRSKMTYILVITHIAAAGAGFYLACWGIANNEKWSRSE